MNNLKKFAAIILSNGRPEKVFTYETLRRSGYSGRIIVLIDDLDKTGDEYRRIYGDQVVVFDKVDIKNKSECGNNFNDLRSTIYPRNAMFDVAKKFDLDYFIQLDDDYTAFEFRFDNNLNYLSNDRPGSYRKKIINLDKILDHMVGLCKSTPITSLCFSQGGDFIGGKDSFLANSVRIKRKGMNSFICATEKPFLFFSQLNEDVTTVVKLGSLGKLFFMTNQISLEQIQTQKNAGGMTEIYLDSGTYVKSFYSVMYQPSSVKIRPIYTSHARIHHMVSWRHTVPMILRQSVKK